MTEPLIKTGYVDGKLTGSFKFSKEELERAAPLFEGVPVVSELPKYSGKPVTGYEVYRWPEFIAFAERLGFAYTLGTIDTVIEIPLDGMCKVYQSYLPEPKRASGEVKVQFGVAIEDEVELKPKSDA